MPIDDQLLDKITKTVSVLGNVQIDETRTKSIADLLKTTINGDTVTDHLALNAIVRQNVSGVLLYILTNNRLIKFDIDPQELKSTSFPLDTITGFERTLEGNREGVKITFQSGATFGLNYTTPNPTISNFFQKVDQARASRAVPGSS